MNKKLSVLVAFSFVSSVAMAQVSPAANSGANAGATGTGGNLNYSPVSNDTVRYATSSAFAPPLTATEPCMGSSSIGATGMSFGVAMGSTWTDNTCEMIKKADVQWNMGQHASAMAILCTDGDIAYSIAMAGGIEETRRDGATVRIGCPEMTKAEWIAAGRPIIDPITKKEVKSGEVIALAPPKAPEVPRIVASVDRQGVVTETFPVGIMFPEDVEARAAIVKANASMKPEIKHQKKHKKVTG